MLVATNVISKRKHCGIFDYSKRLVDKIEGARVVDLRTSLKHGVEIGVVNYSNFLYSKNLISHLLFVFFLLKKCKKFETLVLHESAEFNKRAWSWPVNILILIQICILLKRCDRWIHAAEPPLSVYLKLNKNYVFCPVPSNFEGIWETIPEYTPSSLAKNILIFGGGNGLVDGIDLSGVLGAHFFLMGGRRAGEFNLSKEYTELSDLAPQEVVKILIQTDVLFMPYVDGVNFKRGVFSAALELGIKVITTKGKFTKEGLVGDDMSLVFVPLEILKSREGVARLLTKNATKTRCLVNRGVYVNRCSMRNLLSILN